VSALALPHARGVELEDAFACFGGTCGVWVTAGEGDPDATRILELVKHRLLGWHSQFTRFDPASELSRLNRDPSETVPASATMIRFVRAARAAAELTGGLVDPTLLEQIEQAGYRVGDEAALPLSVALAIAPPRSPARPRPSAGWRGIEVDDVDRTVRRPVGLALDGGGIVKGLCADMIAESLWRLPGYAIDCCGDLRIGGSDPRPRAVRVESPFDGATLHELQLRAGGIATSGIGRRSWIDDRGRPAHHLLDPASGRPAYTGIVQVSALAPTALEAEIRAKAALLSGPDRAWEWLPHGGVVVLEDGSFEALDPPTLTADDRD
jgi:FAD:protein FMN transferase